MRKRCDILTLFLVLALAATSVGADAPSPGGPAGGLTLKEKTLLEKPSPLRGAFYVSTSGVEMMTYGARSTDNGATWVPDPPQPDFQAGLVAELPPQPLPGLCRPGQQSPADGGVRDGPAGRRPQHRRAGGNGLGQLHPLPRLARRRQDVPLRRAGDPEGRLRLQASAWRACTWARTRSSWATWAAAPSGRGREHPRARRR